MRPILGPLLLTVACTGTPALEPMEPDASADADALPPAKDAEPVEQPDAAVEVHDAGDAGTCALGRSCNAIVVDTFPFVDQRDTAAAESREIDRYSCAADTDESGAEYWYRIDIAAAGSLQVVLDDLPGDLTDVDLHLLSNTDAASCLARDNLGFTRMVAPGSYFLTADTWVDDQGAELAGPYQLTVGFTATPTGACAMVDTDLRMVWTSCAASVPNCFEAPGPNGDLARFLRTPAVGPVVKEAHLVTTDEDFGGGWPSSFTDQIERHYQISELASGWSLPRTEPWAPAGEGGSSYGQGSTGVPVPVLDEAWYLNMYWRDRPTPGTRMIVRNPENGLAVVASAGYETGPGSNTAIGGVAEEIHLHLGTQHRDDLEIGFAADQSLPLGPIDCR